MRIFEVAIRRRLRHNTASEGMSLLVKNDHELFLDCVRELHSFRELSALRLWLLETALPKLVPSDWYS